MERKTRVGLDATVANLRELSFELEGLLSEITDGPVREDLEQMLYQAETAINYYSSLVPAQGPEPVPEVVQRIAQAAVVPVGGIGLHVSGFSYSAPGEAE